MVAENKLQQDTYRDSSRAKHSEPFLKWAGGKRWLILNYANLIPNKFETYFEPFLGSGAMFFFLSPIKSVISDANPALINCYNAIKTDPDYITEKLKFYHNYHCKSLYYETRAIRGLSPLDEAAAFIYLNRVCWNGLYRVNKSGAFNVPIGTKTNVIRNFDDFFRWSSMLENSKVLNSDFEDILEQSNSGDFVFVDPPYTVKHDNNGFVKYNENIFSWNDQIRLRSALERASNRGVKLLITNANHSSVKDLYHGFGTITSATRNSVISGKRSGRSVATELLIRNYQ